MRISAQTGGTVVDSGQELHDGAIAPSQLSGEHVSAILIPPASFLPLAERFGLAPEIDRWVVGQAIELLSSDPGGTIALAINLSAHSLDDEALLALVESEVASAQVDPRRLIFEITETAAVSKIALARNFAERLTQIGCRFALDDFGAGFEAVVRIARGLGKETIAEFVSDPQLEEFVRSQGVDHAQGFHVGRPVPVTQLGLGRPARVS